MWRFVRIFHIFVYIYHCVSREPLSSRVKVGSKSTPWPRDGALRFSAEHLPAIACCLLFQEKGKMETFNGSNWLFPNWKFTFNSSSELYMGPNVIFQLIKFYVIELILYTKWKMVFPHIIFMQQQDGAYFYFKCYSHKLVYKLNLFSSIFKWQSWDFNYICFLYLKPWSSVCS